jgi:hypothetical protein
MIRRHAFFEIYGMIIKFGTQFLLFADHHGYSSKPYAKL